MTVLVLDMGNPELSPCLRPHSQVKGLDLDLNPYLSPVVLNPGCTENHLGSF